MIVEREDNSGLYFIVGGLLVAVVVFSIYYFNTRDNTAPVSDTATVSAPAQPATGNSMSLSVDNNGVKATTETKQ